MKSDLQSMIDDLDEREAKIIKLRFGLEGDAPVTLEEVGHMFGITRERVRQLQNIALSRMRKVMECNERQHTAEEIEDELREKRRMEVFKEFYEATSLGA